MKYYTVMKMTGLMLKGKTCVTFKNKMQNKSQAQRSIKMSQKSSWTVHVAPSHSFNSWLISHSLDA